MALKDEVQVVTSKDGFNLLASFRQQLSMYTQKPKESFSSVNMS